jgi:lysozyme
MNLTKLEDELTRDEGKRLIAYKDSRGFWTVGVGHLLGSTPRMSSVTDAECYAMLDADIAEAVAAVRRVFSPSPGWEDAEDVRMRALVNMTFNRGEEGMRSSTTITPAIKAAMAGTGSWTDVATAIAASPWAAQVGARATRLAHMLETGKAA